MKSFVLSGFLISATLAVLLFPYQADACSPSGPEGWPKKEIKIATELVITSGFGSKYEYSNLDEYTALYRDSRGTCGYVTTYIKKSYNDSNPWLGRYMVIGHNFDTNYPLIKVYGFFAIVGAVGAYFFSRKLRKRKK